MEIEYSVKDTLDLFHAGNWVEIRLLNVPNGGTVRGYYNDYKKAERDIAKYNGKVNVYMTLNAINPDIVARSRNKLVRYAKATTSDKEIEKRDWLMIDLDPIRPSGISANDKELESALELAEQVKQFLLQENFSEPVVAMSGNGYHLLYPVDLANTEEITSLIKNFLKVLDKKFSNEAVKIDTTTYNASRITKLYGTISCKGDDTEERPHRQTGIISVPESLIFADYECISSVVATYLDKKASTKSHVGLTNKKPEYSMDAKIWLESQGIEIDHEKELDNGGICYVLKTCPWNSNHVDKGAFVIQYPNGKISAKCHHDSCSEENWDSLQRLYASSSQSIGQKHVKDKSDASTTEIILAEIEEHKHTFFHDGERTGYVQIPGSCTQYLPIHSREYELLLRHIYFDRFKKTLNQDIMHQIQDTLQAEAVYSGELKRVYTRCAFLDNCFYYYLADREETVIAINENGYKVCAHSPVPFIRKGNISEQVIPESGDISLRKLTHRHWKFQSKADKMLHDILLVSRFIPDIPAPIMLYMGTRGSAKTTSMMQDKMTVDPNVVKVKAMPKCTRDLVTSLASQYMVCFDNIDRISGEISDLLCIASTGGHYPSRKLYTDSDEYLTRLNTRLNVTCINMPTNRPDLYDRAVILTLKRLNSSGRKTLEEVMKAFKKDIPFLLDAIFKTLSKAIKIRKGSDVKKLPRMADFALWGYSIAEALSYGGERFLEVYENNRSELTSKLIEEDLLATIIISYCEEYTFIGSMTELLTELTVYAQKKGINTQHGWVQTARSLSHRLNELASLLAEFDIYFERKKSGGERILNLWKET